MNFGRIRRAAWALSMLMLCSTLPAAAQQGATTGTFRGRVASGNQPVAGAQVVAINTATGVQRGALTDTEGRYIIPLLQPGGPYTVRVQSIGYQPKEQTGLRLTAGEATTVNFDLAVQAVQLAELQVDATAPRIDVTQGGVVTRVGTEQVEGLPVAGRDFTDFLNLSPLVSPQPGIGTGGQFSVSGMRTSGTNVQIDGADANNIYFGENRGSSRSPFAFSLESIREFQLITNGYDVEYGNYQGGVVNAVTKSGTNEFSGSAFYFRRGEALTGDDFNGAPPRDYNVHQFGASFSGPIMRDKLHFFVSADIQRKAQPIFASVPGQGTTTLIGDSVTRFINALRDRYGITDPQRYYGQFDQEENNLVLFGRLDWNIDNRHRLTLRQNYSDFEQTNDRLSATEAITSTGPFKDKVWSTVAELNSVFNASAFNTLRFQWSYEDRPRPGAEDGGYIPTLSVSNVSPGTSMFFGGDGTIFRNRLEEKKLQLIDNFSYRLGAHTMKVGGSVLFGSNINTFWLSGNGSFSFNSLSDFEAGIPNRYSRNMRACPVPLVENVIGEAVICPEYDVPLAEFDYTEYAAYIQDDFQVTDRLLLTAGLRFSTTTFPDKPAVAQMVLDSLGYRTNVMPEFSGLSPRLSFAYDFGEARRVLRGGVALLTGRAPTVLAGNAISTERPLLSISCSGADIPTLNAQTIEQYFSGSGQNNPAACRSGAAPTGRPEYTLFDNDFKLPQTLKASLGYEHLFPTNTKLSLDFIYSNAKNQFTVKDLNLGARACQNGSVVGRNPEAVQECFTLADENNRPVYVPAAQFNPRNAASAGATANNRNTVNALDRVYYNASDGEAESFNISVTIDQRISNALQVGASYAWVRAYDNSSFSCCTSNEGFGGELTAGNPNVVGDKGDDDLLWGPSRFERRHTFVANFLWKAPYGINLSGIWRSQSGLPFTPVVDGDANGDGQTFNDRAMISRDLQFQSAQDLERLEKLLDDWKCLREQEGQIAKRNSCRGPWWHSLDLRIAKEIPTFGAQRAELLVDIFNVLNGLNSDWGRYMGVFTSSTNLLRAQSYDTATGRTVYTVNYTPASGDQPARGFGVAQPTGFDPYQFQMQLGIRYRF